jgi:hypothetical protein
MPTQKADFFSFLSSIDAKKYNDLEIARMNLRYRFIVEQSREEIEGRRVLDLASHDGRWAYAFAGAGAREVVGIEGRQELVDVFQKFPETEYKKNVSLSAGDIYEKLRALVERSERFDIVGVLGIYYHIMDHYGLLVLIDKLKPTNVIIDSEFMVAPWAFVAIFLEDTSKERNTTAYHADQMKAPVGTSSRKALELMAKSLGYQTQWLDWESVDPDERRPVRDYYRQAKRRRFTCLLRKQQPHCLRKHERGKS